MLWIVRGDPLDRQSRRLHDRLRGRIVVLLRRQRQSKVPFPLLHFGVRAHVFL